MPVFVCNRVCVATKETDAQNSIVRFGFSHLVELSTASYRDRVKSRIKIKIKKVAHRAVNGDFIFDDRIFSDFRDYPTDSFRPNRQTQYILQRPFGRVK